MKRIIDFVEQQYVSHKWRVTAGVRNVCEVFQSHPHSLLTPPMICDALETKERPMDLTTAYRILERLKQIKAIHEISGAFIICSDPYNTEEDHHFLIDTNTGHAEEIFLDYRDSISAQLKEEKNFDLEDVSLVFYGRFKTPS